MTNRSLCRGVERWVSSEWWWRWCHADACPHRCIGKVTSTSTVKIAHWWLGEGYPVYKGENLPCPKDWSTSLTSLPHWHSTISRKPVILFLGYKDRKSGKNGMTVDEYFNTIGYDQRNTSFILGGAEIQFLTTIWFHLFQLLNMFSLRHLETLVLVLFLASLHIEAKPLR